MFRFVCLVLVLAWRCHPNEAVVPVDQGELLWSQEFDEFGSKNDIVHVKGQIFISDAKCGVKVLDMDGSVVGNIAPAFNKRCPSGLAFAEDLSFFVLAGYFVNDDENTLVTAYNATTLSELWDESKIIEGLFEGNPVVSTDGLYLFLVTNSMNKTRGNLVVLDNSNGATVFTEISGDSEGEDRPIAYAPLGVGRDVDRGNWNSGGRNSNDMLVWGELYMEERGMEQDGGVTVFDGTLHFFQLPRDFQPSQNNTVAASGIGNGINKTTLSAPVIPKHGRGACFSFNSGMIRCWSKGHFFGKTPTVKFNLTKEFNNTSPGPNGGTLAFDDTIYVVPGPSGMPYIYAFELFENRTHPFESMAIQLWNISTPTLVETNIKTAFNDTLMYYIESEGGHLKCVETMTGIEQWKIKTSGDVTSDFKVIDDKYLIFGTTTGKASLIRIGNGPCDSPSAPPSIVESNLPSDAPSSFPSWNPSETPSYSPSGVSSIVESNLPSDSPSSFPSEIPSYSPSATPSAIPSASPTRSSSDYPTPSPTPSGTDPPTKKNQTNSFQGIRVNSPQNELFDVNDDDSSSSCFRKQRYLGYIYSFAIAFILF